MNKKIAKYLQLPDIASYRGHTLRRTGTTWLADSGASQKEVKLYGDWKNDSVPNRYIDKSEAMIKALRDKIYKKFRKPQWHRQVPPNSPCLVDIAVPSVPKCPITKLDESHARTTTKEKKSKERVTSKQKEEDHKREETEKEAITEKHPYLLNGCTLHGCTLNITIMKGDEEEDPMDVFALI